MPWSFIISTVDLWWPISASVNESSGEFPTTFWRQIRTRVGFIGTIGAALFVSNFGGYDIEALLVALVCAVFILLGGRKLLIRSDGVVRRKYLIEGERIQWQDVARIRFDEAETYIEAKDGRVLSSHGYREPELLQSQVIRFAPKELIPPEAIEQQKNSVLSGTLF